ncbi:hypothetical protein [Parvicella tangerina]|uniref:Uncharacterized protein n=1 Tax=Parvicella tangerina TaxID=2829795 RepID=A0A916JQ13_9FLAO|nr:hypothetical protein [Parvicella tangerina]CAG5086433.1 hypothetical protein CRYO30217_03119 [Parvicella tangerina]
MYDALFYIGIGIVGIFAGRFFKKFAAQQQAKMEEKKREKENS